MINEKKFLKAINNYPNSLKNKIKDKIKKETDDYTEFVDLIDEGDVITIFFNDTFNEVPFVVYVYK